MGNEPLTVETLTFGSLFSVIGGLGLVLEGVGWSVSGSWRSTINRSLKQGEGGQAGGTTLITSAELTESENTKLVTCSNMQLKSVFAIHDPQTGPPNAPVRAGSFMRSRRVFLFWKVLERH
jgi:hypothetical protein